MTKWGWVTTRKRAWRYLGRRKDNRLFLLADLAARNATGEERLVSREVLGITIEAPPVGEVDVRRGAGRRWGGTETEGGRDLDGIW